jgi:hypothetical protein
MAVNLHGISQDSFDLIVDEEVSGRATYEKKYVHPEKPGGQSGVTVGCGYDCGYSSAATIRSDWGGKIPAAMVEALASCAGIKGDAAFAACERVRESVSVPWEAAIEVFSNVSIPKYMAATRKGLPGYDGLPPDCKGVLLSLVYNRGASFTLPGDRYSEMRAIRAAMISGDLAAIPGELRKMKRLWTAKSVRGVALRREHEAKLFERGLASRPAATAPQPAPAAPEPDEEGTAPFPMPDPIPPVAAPIPADPAVTGDPELYSVQKRLKERKYSPGIIDGLWGSGVAGALGGFINDRGCHIPVPASLDAFNAVREDIKAELGRAESEAWFRPVSDARKAGDAKTVSTVAPEVVPVKRNFLVTAWGAFGTFLYGVYNSVSGYVSQAWDFFTDHKDDLPSDPSYLSTVWEYLGKVPTTFWILLGAAALAFVALDARKGVNKITQSVQSGERQ